MAKKIDNGDNLYSSEELEQLAQRLNSEVQYDEEEELDEYYEDDIDEENEDQYYEDYYEDEEGDYYRDNQLEKEDYGSNEVLQNTEEISYRPVMNSNIRTEKEIEHDSQSVKTNVRKPNSQPTKQVKRQRQPKPRPERQPQQQRVDINKVPETLAEFEALKAYKQTDEYKQEVVTKKETERNLSDKDEVRRILDSSKIDLSDLGSITIQDKKRTITGKDSMTYLRSADPTYQVVLNQSAYIADMKSLKFKDIFALSNSVNNTYSGALDKYQTYFKAISDNSLGVTDFEKWAEITSLYDIPTLEFGIFCQTFPGETEFDIRCSNCGKTMKNVGISNDYLISTRNDEVYDQLDRVINSINDLEKASTYSLVNKITRFQLPDTSAVIDIHIPTVADYLKLLEQIPDGKLKSVENYIDVLLFIKDIFLVDLVASKEADKPIFSPLSSRNDILAFLKDMSLDDVAKLNKEIGDKDRQYRIDYQIQSFSCQHCGEETGNIDIDIESLLFEQAVAKLLTP